MTDLYSKPSISGYNSNPPSDDGSNTAANEITWAGIKNKLTDPIKTLLDSVNNNADTLADSLFGKAVTEVSTNTNLATGDMNKLLVTTNAITLTLLDGADAGSNYVFSFRNNDASNSLTLGRNGANINDAASDLTVLPGEGGIAFCDGTDWWVVKPDKNPAQVVNTTDNAVATTSTGLPANDTIPQNTEGAELMTLAITPKSSSNILKIEVHAHCSASTNTGLTIALFQDSTADSIACSGAYNSTSNRGQVISFIHYMTAGTASATTFKVRGGSSSGTFTFNGESGSRLYGGVLSSSITITEYKPN